MAGETSKRFEVIALSSTTNCFIFEIASLDEKYSRLIRIKNGKK